MCRQPFSAINVAYVSFYKQQFLHLNNLTIFRLFDKKGEWGKITNQSIFISKENTHKTMHGLYIESTRTCKSRYHKNTGNDELDGIKKTMWLNGYPEKLITKTIK